MSICFDESRGTVHLTNGRISYVMQLLDGRYLLHRYFGPVLRRWRGTGVPQPAKRSYTTEYGDTHLYFDALPWEFPVAGRGDYRRPAFSVTGPSGTPVSELLFQGWRVLDKKPGSDTLPVTFAVPGESETLAVDCVDAVSGAALTLYYTIFADVDVIARRQRVTNPGTRPLYLTNLQSVSLQLPAGSYDMLTLYGCHAREAQQSRAPLHQGVQAVGSRYGSSSPRHQPFWAVLDPAATETAGAVYGCMLVYSGNFNAVVEQDAFGAVRAQMGLGDESFTWTLAPGETFETPEALLTFSGRGLNGMSHSFHTVLRRHLLPPRWQGVPRPVLLNSWEGMYYDVSLEKIETQARLAKELGMELFVLDDGWFRKGNDSRSSMGDWTCNTAKLPGGIEAAADLVHGLGLKFGLWFEPEAVSRDSDLYRAHPDWILQVPGLEPREGRHEYLLDLSRAEVRRYLLDVLHRYLGTGKIDYIKWDMNRPLTDAASAALPAHRQGEVPHRYVLGLYEILREITQSYPQVLFEGCSSGGARLDAGMLAYFAQNWTSDNTDARDRTDIQAGFSLLYPPEVLGAHVSITPNHQTGRTTPLETRFAVARLFNLGYELDLTRCTPEERAAIAAQVATAKAQRDWLMQGTFWRHPMTRPGDRMTSVVSADQSCCLAVIFRTLYDPLGEQAAFKFCGLDPAREYRDAATGEIYGGDELMEAGLTLPPCKQDFAAYSVLLCAEEETEYGHSTADQ